MNINDFIGQKMSDEILKKIESIYPKVRVFSPGSAHTMEFRADRINIQVGEAGIITGFVNG